jgi:isoquinoline 1-oxidoreductase beta subunit
LPGLLYASVERNPRFWGKVKSFDDSAAKAVPGVKHVLAVKMKVFLSGPRGRCCCCGFNLGGYAGKKSIKIVWDDSGFDHHSTDQLYAAMREDVKSKKANEFRTKGDFDTVYQKASKKLKRLMRRLSVP